MKKLIIFTLSLAVFFVELKAQTIVMGHQIKVNVPSLANQKLYLGSYYEKRLIVADSTRLDNLGNGEFSGTTPYTKGVYFLVTPSLAKMNDFIMGDSQNFSIFTDTIPNAPQTILGSIDNDLFKEYNDYILQRTQNIQNLERAFSEAGLFPDSNERRANISNEYKQVDADIKTFRNQIAENNSETFIATLFNIMKRPEYSITDPLPLVNGKPDSTYPYRFIKEHYWDNVYFNDPSLIRTPFFEDKLDEYFSNWVSPDPDSSIKEIRYIMAFARSNREMYSYFLNKFTNKFWSPKYLGQDKIFVFLYENYFSKGDTSLVTAESRKNVRENYFKLVGNFVGTHGAPIVLRDTAGNKISLYNVKSPLIFLIFWDPSCGHCRTQVPRVDSFYQALWKDYGVKVFTMNMNRNNDLNLWKNFLNEFHLQNWYNGYEPDEDEIAEAKLGRNIRQSYAISSTPTFFLLDKDKRIIGKSLDFEQYTDLIKIKYRQYQEEAKKNTK